MFAGCVLVPTIPLERPPAAPLPPPRILPPKKYDSIDGIWLRGLDDLVLTNDHGDHRSADGGARAAAAGTDPLVQGARPRPPASSLTVAHVEQVG